MVSKLTRMTITMYGADWCGDCRRAEKFFVDNNIDFQKVDFKLDANDGKYDFLMKNGHRCFKILLAFNRKFYLVKNGLLCD